MNRHLKALIRWVRRFNRPTTGTIAVWLWQESNRMPYGEGKKLLSTLGYIPYSGYPLKRKVYNHE